MCVFIRVFRVSVVNPKEADVFFNQLGPTMRPQNYYKSWKEIRAAFLRACNKNGIKPAAKSYRAYIHGLRLMRFTSL